MFNKLIKNQFVRGGFIFSMVAFSASFVNYLFNLIIARGFSLSDYGEYMSALSVAAVLSVPLVGFSFVIIKKIGSVDSKDRVAVALGIEEQLLAFFRKNLFLILLITVLAVGFIYLKANLALSSAVFSVILVFFSLLLGFYSATLQAYKKFMLAGVFGLSQVAVKVLGGLVVVWFFPKLINMYLIIILSFLVSFYLGKKFIRQKSIKKIKINKINILKLAQRKSIWLPTLASLGMMSFLNLDLIMVKSFFSASDVGLYASLALMSKIIFFVVSPLTTVAFTFFSDKENKQNNKKILFLSIFLIILASLVAVLGYYFLPKLIINLIFDQRYLVVAPVLFLAGIFGAVYSLINLFSQYFLSKHSLISLLPIIFAIFQILGIYLFHQDFKQVYIINIISVSLLLLTFLMIFLKENFYARK